MNRNTLWIYSWLAVALLTANITAQEIGFVEEFALAPDRTKPLATLVPGTEDYYYYHCLHFQNTEQYDRVSDLLKPWIDRFGESARVVEIRNRQALLTYSQDPPSTLEYLRNRLGLSFHHQRELPDAQRDLPNKLNPATIAYETFLRQAYVDHVNTDGFEDTGLDRLATGELDNVRLRHLLQRLTTPDAPGLVPLIARELKLKDSGGFGSMPIHGALTRAQLDELRDAIPQLANESNFVSIYLTKIRPSDDLDPTYDLAAQIDLLDRLWEFAQPLEPVHNSLKASILYRRLATDLRLGVYDKARFLQYIQLPRSVFYINQEFLKRVPRGTHYADLNADYFQMAGLPIIGNDEPLIRQYLQQFFRDAADIREFEPWIETGYLRRQFAETKIVNGLGDRQQWDGWLSPDEYRTIVQRVDLDFPPNSPHQYAVDQPVELKLHVKNVDKLLVKVFELNTENYYRSRSGRIDSDINLDGLVAHHEFTHEYQQPPHLRHEESFTFDLINRPGVFVIDFIGNGKSSRALIRKGYLHHLVETTVAGQQFTLLDENRQPIKDGTLWMAGREYQPDEDGRITVPFSTQPGMVPIVLSRGGLSVPASFFHEGETYELNAGLYVDRESLLRGNKAELVIRPGLRLNGIPASLKLVNQPRVRITAVDMDGIVSVMEYPGIQLTEAEETIQAFQTPPRLRKISIELLATVDSVSQSKPVELRTLQSFEINEIETTDSIRDVHLVQSEDRFVLEVRGKTGEPRARQAVHVRLKHRDFRRPAEATFQTDDTGRIELGQLPDIVSLQAVVAGTPQREWMLPQGESTMARSIHAPAGKTIVVPILKSADGDIASAYTLFEMRGGTFVSDQSDRVQLEDGALTIAELAPGNYQLRHKATGQVVQLRVTEGDVVSSFALGRDRFLELRSVDTPYIHSHEISEDAIRVRLGGDLGDARIHVFAARQSPRFRTQNIIASVRDAEPLSIKPSADQSVYIAGRDIGDEFRYILDRKFAPRYAGNMLDRPSLLLSPWATRTTDTLVQVAAEGDDFSAAGGGSEGESRRSGAVDRSDGLATDPASLDFLQYPSVVLTNLRPDEQGVVTIDRASLGPKTQLQIVLVGDLATQSLPVALPEVELNTRDLRLATAIDPERHFAQAKQVTILPADKELTIDDVGSARLQTIDDLGDVYRVFAAISQNGTLAEFNFVIEWSTKTEQEKRELYSKYACHELNFFLSKKDPEFYASVVHPFLASKRSKTFVDQWLLQQPVDAYFDPWEFGRLNVAERIMLSQVSGERRAMLSRHIRELYELSPTPRRVFDRLYDLSLKSNALDASEVAVLFSSAGEKLAKAANEPAAPQQANAAPAPSGEFGGAGGGMGGDDQSALRAGAARPESAGRREARFNADAKSLNSKALRNDEVFKDGSSESKNRLGADARQRVLRDQFEDKELLERQLEQRKQVAQLYRRIDQTSEWIENNYYHIPADQQSPQLVTVNRFWRDYVEHPEGEPFLSPYFAEAAGSFTQMMFALAVIDLPFEANEHTFDFADNTLKIVPKSPIIVLHQQVQPAVLDPREANLLIGENYFRVDDRYRQVGDQRYDKFIVDEFVTHVLYGAQVVVTNPTSTPQPIDLLMQIPQGAIPANNSHVTRAIQLDMQPFSTQTVEYFFYFPRSGQFQHYPAHVALDQRTIAFANPLSFNVVDQPTRIDKSSWAYVSQNGNDDEVIEFLRRENVQRLDLSKIAFRMRDAAFFASALDVLRDRLAYNAVLWSYGILHNNVDAIREFLTGQEDFARQVGFAVDSPLLTVDPVTRRWYEHREYWPLANARTYRLGQQRQITNDVIRGQYQQLLGYLSCRREFSADDRMALVYYLLLQDRIDEAVGFFRQIQPGSVHTPLQYDYLATYLAMSLEELDKAEQIAVTRKEFPVDRWRKMFENVLAQVREARGGTPDPSDPLNRDQQQAALAAKAPNFEFDVEARKVTLRYQNLSEATINYYRMDLELLFSRNPFVQQGSTGFSLIRPNVTQTLELPGDQVQTSFDLPAEFLNSNVLVEIVAGGQTKSTAYYANSLAVQVSETYGQLKVAHLDDGKPLSKVYVKVYARMNDGSVAFYKDGYTDSRGRFDYSSLSNQSIGDVDRFALLVLSDHNGAMVREAATPKE